MYRSALTEKELLHQFSGGDPAALEALVNTYFPVLCRFAEKFLPDSSLAKDIVQETFINLWKTRRSFDSLDSLRSFLFAAARNGCLNHIRGRERQENKHQAASAQNPLEMDSVLTEIVHAEFFALIYETVRLMSPQMQEIFYLSFKEGLTVKEISIHLNMNIKAVKKQKYKALVILRGKFGGNREALLVLLPLLLR
jgi:RNA polymerase sigma-70 factor (family 1)